MDNTYYLQLLAEAHQDRLLETNGQTRVLRGRPHLSNARLRKVIRTSGGYLVRAGVALEGLARRGEAARLSSNGSSASTWRTSSMDV
jgi:hypothetical protein